MTTARPSAAMLAGMRHAHFRRHGTCTPEPACEGCILLAELDSVIAERDEADLARRLLTAKVDQHVCVSAVPAYLVAFHEAWMKAPPLVRAGTGANLLTFASRARQEADESANFCVKHGLQRRTRVCYSFSDVAGALFRLALSLTEQADNDAEATGIDADTGAKP